MFLALAAFVTTPMKPAGSTGWFGSAAGALVLGATLAGCQNSDGGSPGTPTGPTPLNPPAVTAEITITGFGLKPFQLTISQGTRVTFINNDDNFSHNMTSSCSEIEQLGLLAPGQSRATAGFARPGRCVYTDRLQPGNPLLKGAIDVQ
jgi:plastocyanin